MSGEVKRLYRSRSKRWLAGVCGGLGDYFGLDPTLIRVLFVLFALAVGGGILAYLILWLIIPLEPQASPAAPEATAQDEAEEAGYQE
jgi:phage shock protein C